MKISKLADNLAWPEGPTPLGDGRIAFVETYRSQVSVWTPGKGVSQLAYVGGGPNAALKAEDGCIYVTQNGGVIGPWRAKDKRPPSIQVILPDGKVEIFATKVDGITLQAPNDLAFGPDGRLYFTDPGGAFDPVNRPDPSRLFAIAPDGKGELIAELPPVYSNGICVDANGDLVWVETYTNAVKRRTRDGRIIDLCTLPDKGKPDGFKIAANGDFYITALLAEGLDVVHPDGSYRQFIKVGKAPTNCVFVERKLYVTDGGSLGMSTEGDAAGALWLIEFEDVAGMKLFPGKLKKV
ncbi:MAG TPA: SMP-30/gluconolactonase/LRE family protein [Dongiaceae bacterium]|nr:SMP-30/gluconolactonase/LRE family protein [Dongiaceae bacterium]